MTEPEPPVIHTLTRPIIAGRYITIDWDELRELSTVAGLRVSTSEYAQGVQDALRWLADGGPTPSLLQLLGRK